RCVPSTIVVNNPTDIPVAGETDLRQAIVQANSSLDAATITFDPKVFATPQTILLVSGQLELSNTTAMERVSGPKNGVTINGNNASRILLIDGGVTASLSGLTITGGRASHGGGLYNLGTASLTNCSISGNSASSDGGGLRALNATTTLTNCSISGNS